MAVIESLNLMTGRVVVVLEAVVLRIAMLAFLLLIFNFR